MGRSGDSLDLGASTARRRFAALTATIALVAMACGGGATPTPATPATQPPAAATPSGTAETPAPSAPTANFPQSPPAADDAGPLALLEWSGYEIPDFTKAFTSKYPNAKLDFQFADGGASFFSKVKTGAATVDIAHPCSNWTATWVDNDLLAPIDVSRLSNWEQLDPTMRGLGKVGDQVYFIPWDWGFDSMIVNTDTVKAEDIPTSWKDLWDPKYAGRIALEDYAEVMVALAATAWDLPYPDLSEADLAVVKEKLIALKKNVKTFWGAASEVVQLMSSGEVDMAYGWNDTYSNVLKAGVKATYIEPKEGRAGWVCGFVVPKATQHYDLALAYIDAAISKETGAQLIDQYFLGHSNVEALGLANPETVKVLQLDQLDVRKRTRFALPLTDAQRESFSRVWAEVLASN